MSQYIARRKGNMYREFDTARAKMGPWKRIPQPPMAYLTGYTEGMSFDTVPELKARAARWGLSIPSKMRKAELLDIIAVRSWYRGFQVGGA